MAYRCDQAVFGAAREAIRCKVSGSVCAHQKMCMMEGRTVLTDGAMRCPGRDGRLEDGAAETQQEKAGAAKTQQKKTAVRPAAKKRSTAVSTRKTVRKTADKK